MNSTKLNKKFIMEEINNKKIINAKIISNNSQEMCYEVQIYNCAKNKEKNEVIDNNQKNVNLHEKVSEVINIVVKMGNVIEKMVDCMSSMMKKISENNQHIIELEKQINKKNN